MSKPCPVRLGGDTHLTIAERLAGFIKTLRVQEDPLAEFDEQLWGCMVDYVTVVVDGGMTVVFRDGTAVQT